MLFYSKVSIVQRERANNMVNLSNLRDKTDKTKKYNLLLVDDATDVLIALQQIVSRFFKNTYIANDGVEALEIFNDPTKNIDIVATDVVMPHVNGVELAKAIRKKSKKTPIIVLSAFSDATDLIELLNLDISAFLLKPVVFEDFIEKAAQAALNLEKIEQQEYNAILLEEYKQAVDESTILSICDAHGSIKYINEQFIKISKYSRDELIGRSHNILRHPDSEVELFKDLWRCIKSGKVWNGIIKNLAKDGSVYILDSTIIPIMKNNELYEAVGIRHDITSQFLESNNLKLRLEQSNTLLKNYKQIDGVTGLGNQQALLNFINNNQNSQLTIIGIKINNLKNIIDVMGWEYSDKFISEYTQVLSSYLMHVDGMHGLYRVYFDQLIVAFKNNNEILKRVAKEIFHFSKYFICENDNITMSSPITAVVLSGNSNIYEQTLSALNYTFENFKGEINIVDDLSSIPENQLPTNIYWLNKYSTAIEQDRLSAFYQPILNNKNKQIEKFECLARINCEENGVIPPSKFVSIVQNAGQLSFLTKSIIKSAFQYFSTIPNYEFSINFGAADLQDDELLKQLYYWQNKTQIDPKRVVIEILESEDIYKYNILKKKIAEIKSAGFKIAIDDFGTGYSNFIALYEYKVDFIKIDGSFINKLEHDDSMFEIVTHLQDLISMCGAKSIAEFVSSEKIFNRVNEIGIDYSQGYFIGEPKPSIVENSLHI